MKHCRKSLLFYKNEAWKKKDNDATFTVTMESSDGAGLCELIRIYIQSLLTNILSKDNMSLYRDHVLFILRKINKQQRDRIRKKIINIFKNIDFKIKIVTNLTEVDFLDVTFKTDCSLNDDCRKESVKCKCTGTTCDSKKVYLGLTEGEFKMQRYYNHVKSFRKEFYANSATLFNSVWEMKNRITSSYIGNLTNCESIFQHNKKVFVMFLSS